MSDKMMKVYPNPKLSDLEYVPGVGADGADLPDDQANALLEAGLVVRSKPKSSDVPPTPAADDVKDIGVAHAKGAADA